MKSSCFLLVFIMVFQLFSQNYTFDRCTFNTAGGHQSNSHYSVTIAVAEKIQGNTSSTDFLGYVGFLFPALYHSPPVITSIDDVPNDQGRQVQVVWNRCSFDEDYTFDTFYSLWRLDNDFETRDVSILSSDSDKINNSKIFSDPYMVIKKHRKDPLKTYYWLRDNNIWTFIDEIPALQYEEYSYVAPTLLDSSETEENYSTYKIVYHDLYQYYESVPDSGYSIDNIPPDETRVSITRNGENMRLSWEEIEYGTFEGNRYPEINGIWYKIFASNNPDFVCDETTHLGTVTNLLYDFPIDADSCIFFKIIVSDKP